MKKDPPPFVESMFDYLQLSNMLTEEENVMRYIDLENKTACSKLRRKGSDSYDRPLYREMLIPRIFDS